MQIWQLESLEEDGGIKLVISSGSECESLLSSSLEMLESPY